MHATIHAVLKEQARRSPQHPFLICRDRTLTFVEIEQLSDRLACALRRCEIGRGGGDTLWMENGWRWVVSYFAILKCGATVNPVNVLLTADEVRFILADCGARLLIAGADRLATLGEMPGVAFLTDAPADPV